MTVVQSRILLSGAVLAALGVTFGAFAAHALRETLDAQRLGWWQTAVQYQMWHALALLCLAAFPRMGLPAALLGSGVVVFAGALYLLALTGARWLGGVPPLGGSLMIAGWIVLAWRAFRPASGPRR